MTVPWLSDFPPSHLLVLEDRSKRMRKSELNELSSIMSGLDLERDGAAAPRPAAALAPPGPPNLVTFLALICLTKLQLSFKYKRELVCLSRTMTDSS